MHLSQSSSSSPLWTLILCMLPIIPPHLMPIPLHLFDCMYVCRYGYVCKYVCMHVCMYVCIDGDDDDDDNDVIVIMIYYVLE